MSNTTTTSKPDARLMARRERLAKPAARWQALQTQLPEVTQSAASHWTRRSFVTCTWRAHPADVSASPNQVA